MPFKLHSKGRRHIPRQRYRVTNWREYDASLRNRGSLTIWFTPETIAGWKAQPRTTPGGQRYYSDLAIETALTLRTVFRFAFTPKHGSWLNLVEGFFSKLARSVLRHIRVASKHELAERILAAIKDINQQPVVHTWSYKLEKAA